MAVIITHAFAGEPIVTEAARRLRDRGMDVQLRFDPAADVLGPAISLDGDDEDVKDAAIIVSQAGAAHGDPLPWTTWDGEL